MSIPNDTPSFGVCTLVVGRKRTGMVPTDEGDVGAASWLPLDQLSRYRRMRIVYD